MLKQDDTEPRDAIASWTDTLTQHTSLHSTRCPFKQCGLYWSMERRRRASFHPVDSSKTHNADRISASLFSYILQIYFLRTSNYKLRKNCHWLCNSSMDTHICILSLRYHQIPVMWSETIGLRTRPVWGQNGLGLAVLVLFCKTWSCHARRHLEGHSNLRYYL